MKNYIFIIITIASVLGILGCQEDFTDDIKINDTPSKLIVEGGIQYNNGIDTFQYIFLSRSVSYFSTETPPSVSGANIIIYDDNNVAYPFVEDPNQPGCYKSADKFSGELNMDYTLEISETGIPGDDGKDFYTASSSLKKPINLDSITINITEEWFYNDDGSLNTDIAKMIDGWSPGMDIYTIRGWGNEPGETTGDHYQWLYSKNGVPQTDTLDETIFVDDAFVNGNDILGLEMWMAVPGNSGDTITVESRGITMKYYKYITGVMMITSWNAGVFGGPPANPHSNLTNGALGFFSVYSSEFVSGIIP